MPDEAPRPTPARPWLKGLSLVLQLLVAGAILFFLVRILVSRWQEVAPALRSARLGLLGLSVLLLAGCLLALGLGWHFVLGVLDRRPRPAASVRVFMLSQLGKYLPGNFWHYVGRLVLSRRLSVSTSRAILSLYVEVLLIISGALVVALGSLTAWRAFPLWGRVPLGMGLLAVALGLVHPRMVAVLVRIWKGPEAVPAAAFPARSVYALVPWYVLVWLAVGLAFTVFVSAFTEIGAGLYLRLAGTWAVAVVVGVVTPIAPAGIGVREGVLSLLLTPLVGGPLAVMLALASRLWFILSEVLAALVALVLPGGADGEPR